MNSVLACWKFGAACMEREWDVGFNVSNDLRGCCDWIYQQIAHASSFVACGDPVDRFIAHGDFSSFVSRQRVRCSFRNQAKSQLVTLMLLDIRLTSNLCSHKLRQTCCMRHPGTGG